MTSEFLLPRLFFVFILCKEMRKNTYYFVNLYEPSFPSLYHLNSQLIIVWNL